MIIYNYITYMHIIPSPEDTSEELLRALSYTRLFISQPVYVQICLGRDYYTYQARTQGGFEGVRPNPPLCLYIELKKCCCPSATIV